MTYASERQKEKWNENKIIRTERSKMEFLSKQEQINRCQ